jgi:hypothetical protein
VGEKFAAVLTQEADGSFSINCIVLSSGAVTTALTAFYAAEQAAAKAAVKAAAEDQAAQASLAQTLKNLGLETGNTATSVNDFISTLERQTGILDDDLRPAMDRLLRATGSVTESQKLLNLAIDISAGTGKDLTQVTQGLQKAFLGNLQGLGRLGVGLTKAELKTGNFADITEKLTKLFAGQGKRQADSYAGTIQRLGVAANNAKEIIGEGLIDSIKIFAGTTDIEVLQTKIEEFATSAAEGMKKLAGFIKENSTEIKVFLAIMTATFVSTKIIQGIAATVTAIGLIKKAFTALRASAIATAIASMFALNPYGAAFQVAAMLALIAGTIKAVDALADAYNNANAAKNKLYDPDATGLNHLRELESRYNKAALTEEKKLTAEERKQLKDKRLQLAIDKAKLLLGKADDVFDMEKIQLAAAERNAAEQLGKITSQAQLLQISNDLARLNVKQSILALEDAIASKDIKAIEAGTAKLNKDLAILGVLTGQEIKLRDIESILKDIVPKDLINLKNLDDALAKLKLLGSGIITPLGAPEPTPKAAGAPLTPAEIESLLILGRTVPIVPDSSGGVGYSGNAGNYASSGFPGSAMGYGGGTSKVEVTVVAPAFTDPNAVAEAINQYLQDATDRGTLRVAV